jgi:uncharacterized protein (DUF4415 family)
MARTLDDILASRPVIDHEKVRATTEDEIRRHMIEDGQDPDAPLPAFTRRAPGQRGPAKKPAKVQVTLRVDPAALEAWKASGEGWMTRAADILAREAPRQGKDRP